MRYRLARDQMKSEGWTKASVALALLAIVVVSLASSCAQSTASATSTPSALPSPTPSASLPTASPPLGGPVPAQLLGDWYKVMPSDTFTAMSSYPCPAHPTPANCFFQLTLTATSYNQSFTALGGRQDAGQGDVVVNQREIDFFNGALCGLQLQDGVGRYKWTLTGGVLHLALISDPCPRSEILAYPTGYSHTH